MSITSIRIEAIHIFSCRGIISYTVTFLHIIPMVINVGNMYFFQMNKLAFGITHAQNVIFDHLIIWVNYIITDILHCFQDVVLDLSDMSRAVFISAIVLCLPLKDIRITKTWSAIHKKTSADWILTFRRNNTRTQSTGELVENTCISF